MKTFYRIGITVICVLMGLMFTVMPTRASSVLPWTTSQNVRGAGAVFRGQVSNLQCYQDRASERIHTVVTVTVDEVFKGKLPETLQLDHMGGTFNNRNEMDDLAPQLQTGTEYLFFVSKRPDGTAFAPRGDASVFRLSEDSVRVVSPNAANISQGQSVLSELRGKTANGVLEGDDFTGQVAQSDSSGGTSGGNKPLSQSTATNLLVDANNIGSRHILPDRGEPIPYLIDADFLPSGISQTNAVIAVQQALSAWTSVSSLKYSFLGIQSFGMSAASNTSGDGVLRIQLHDHYGYISGAGGSGDILGRGGYANASSTPTSAGWLPGGNVRGNDFYRTLNPFLVIASTNSFFTGNASNLAEVVCHEVGHSIGLAHSSNTSGETNAYLANATMFFTAHGGSRGAVLGAYDPNAVQQIAPSNNLPPYLYPRYMYVISSPGTITNTSVNAVQLRAYSLEPKSVSLQTNDISNNGTTVTQQYGAFSVTGITLRYTPNGLYGDSAIPAGTSSYIEIIAARISDSTNASPYVYVTVTSFGEDTYNEGVPDSWRATYFGNANPSVGTKHHATDDADGDGYNNLQEYMLGSNPTNKNSNLEITSFATTNLQWQAKPYEVYEIYGSTNLVNWTRVLNPQIPTSTNGTVTGFTNGGPKGFFRVEKVP